VLKYFPIFILAGSLCLASDPGAAALAREARKAQAHGQVVRAYLLFAEAAARDPQNESYRFNRESLKPLANLLSKSNIEPEPSRENLLASVPAGSDENIENLDAGQERKDNELQPPPKLQFEPGRHSFHLRTNERTLLETVARSYHVDVVFDPEFQPAPSAEIDLDSADFRDAMDAVTQSTGTFLFPISPRAIFVARDTSQKRDQYEPEVVFTVPVSDISDQKEIVDIANAARQVFELRHIAFDSEKRAITVRDRISRARAAQVLMENMVHPKPQISIEVQILSLDSRSSLHYGLTIPNSIPIVNFGRYALKQSILNLPQGFTNFLTFGGGQTLFGIGVIGAESFALSSSSWTQSIFDTLTVVSNGQTADLHIGDKFPIAQALYTGVSQLPNALYAPPPQIEQVELGIVLKVTPHLHGNGSITIDLEAAYKALGSLSFNTVPEILQRELKGTVQLEQGEWAVLGGLETYTSSVNRGGLAAVSDVPVVSQLLGDISRNRENSQTLVVIKPHVVRGEPAIDGDEYFVGGQTGKRVLL
jgi:general secretion pathway protein D